QHGSSSSAQLHAQLQRTAPQPRTAPLLTLWEARSTLIGMMCGVCQCTVSTYGREMRGWEQRMSAKTPPGANRPSANSAGGSRTPDRNRRPTGAATGKAAKTTDNRVFVKIPRPGPGQGYTTQRN